MESDKPLFQKKVLVTRSKTQAAEFSEKISAAGGIPIELPLLAFEKPENEQMILETIKTLDTYDWLVFTSKNGVDYFFEFYHLVNREIKGLPKIAVVGTKTKKALEQYGVTPDLVPAEFIAEGLYESLEPYVTVGVRFLLARGNLSRPYLVEKLSESGAKVTDLIVYETVENDNDKTRLIQLLKNKEIDIVTFTSPSTVSQFYKIVKQTEWKEWTKGTVFACIGPQTKLAAMKVGIPIHICPSTYTIDDLLLEIEAHCKPKEE
ncbi:uroporphyrinogen-III synthase [Fredinandcohnia sp. 179-A 10B2 NHS]|uniref:uroporphyrinogen-III synthase n=1 Tax=Fredinandcohnia sp. 179-A 10B2 NHS TaxID=3235176 RepID=UPI00399F027E